MPISRMARSIRDAGDGVATRCFQSVIFYQLVATLELP
jgi:hypothetical protein